VEIVLAEQIEDGEAGEARAFRVEVVVRQSM